MDASNSADAPPLWTIVLAAGEGSRLRPLTRLLHGEDLPKQFAVIHGRRSLLQGTLARASFLSPSDRTVVVVAKEWEERAREQVQDFGAVDLVAQPRNMGTGPGILLPLTRVASRDPDAMVAIMPSDHYVKDEPGFVESIRRAEAVARKRDTVVLGAVVPEGPETQYGWILWDASKSGEGRLLGFVEKPTASVARQLFAAGALWNTFIMVGPARRFCELVQEHLAELVDSFKAYRAALGAPSESSVLHDTYATMKPSDFSKDVLEKSRALCVAPLDACGWSDWGTRERVLRSLRGTSDFDALLARIGENEARNDEACVSSAAE